MDDMRRDHRLQGVNNGIRALMPGLRQPGKREVGLDDYVEEALLYCQQAGEWFRSANRQRAALSSAVSVLISEHILAWNGVTQKVCVPEETEALLERVPNRFTGDSSTHAYIAHAKSLRELFRLPSKVRTKHELQWDNIELESSNADLRRERNSSRQERDAVHEQYAAVCAERDALRAKCTELEAKCDRLMDQFDAQEVEYNQLRPIGPEEPVEQNGAFTEERQLSPQPPMHASGSQRGATPFASNELPRLGVRTPATPSTPVRRPAIWLTATPPKSHNKMRKAQSMPCGRALEDFYRAGTQNPCGPPTPISNPRPFAGPHFEAIQEEPPSPTEERVRRMAPLQQTDHVVVRQPGLNRGEDVRDANAMDEDRDQDQEVPLPLPDPMSEAAPEPASALGEPRSTTSLMDMGKNALYQLASVVASPIRLFGSGRPVETPTAQAEEPQAVGADLEPDAMAVDEPVEEGSESVFNLRDYTPSAGATPPATPSRRGDPFSLRGTQRDRWQEQIGKLEAEVYDLRDELREATLHAGDRDARVDELQRALQEKEAVLRELVQRLRHVMPAFVEAASHIPGSDTDFPVFLPRHA